MAGEADVAPVFVVFVFDDESLVSVPAVDCVVGTYGTTTSISMH